MNLYGSLYGFVIETLKLALANAFLCYYKTLWLNNCPPEIKHVIQQRYVDNLFVFGKSTDHL